MANRGGFSWKRATGVTRTKQRVSRKTGIPLTKSGRQRKVGKMVTGGGCLLPAMLLLLMALVVAGCGGGGSVQPADAPPAGTIWFGSSFDATTFAMKGRATAAATGQTVAYVASLTRNVSTGDVNLRVSVDGTAIVNQAMSLKGSGTFVGATLGPLTMPGTYLLEITDIGGTVLASGALAVH